MQRQCTSMARDMPLTGTESGNALTAIIIFRSIVTTINLILKVELQMIRTNLIRMDSKYLKSPNLQPSNALVISISSANST